MEIITASTTNDLLISEYMELNIKILLGILAVFIAYMLIKKFLNMFFE